MIKLEGMEETTSFIEFYCAPEVEDDDQLDYDRQPIERWIFKKVKSELDWRKLTPKLSGEFELSKVMAAIP